MEKTSQVAPNHESHEFFFSLESFPTIGYPEILLVETYMKHLNEEISEPGGHGVNVQLLCFNPFLKRLNFSILTAIQQVKNGLQKVNRDQYLKIGSLEHSSRPVLVN